MNHIGIVRTVLADKTVRRVMGQSKGDGDGGLATDARANSITWMDQANDGTIFFNDSVELRIRKFTIDGNITAHAVTPPTGVNFLIDKSTKDIYGRSGNYVAKLPFAAPTWANYAAISTTYNSEANSPSEIFGFDGVGAILYNMLPAWDPVLGYRNYKLGSYKWSPTPAAVSVLTGATGSTATFCANGVLAANCSIMWGDNLITRAQYDSLPTIPRWIMLKSGTNRIVALNKDGMNNNEVLVDVATLPRTALSFVYRKVGSTELIDYCGSNGRLYSYNITSPSDSTYFWPIFYDHRIQIESLAATLKSIVTMRDVPL
ncbi:MAG: hypothetical protein EOP09_20820 [Proteobacteria bacterium]|nr:MAG: hypothetical protein EOP09_20820 [Pseudomonadota bacterium]